MSNTPDKIPPQSLEAEMAVLGSMLIEKEAIAKALEWVEEKHFYRESHRKIFKAIWDLYEASEAVDIVTVGEGLRNQKAFSEVGGASYLAELIHSVSTAAHVEHYAKIVREKFILRELISTATQIVSSCYESGEEVGQILDQAESAVFGIAQKRAAHAFKPASGLAHQVIDYIENLHQRKVHVTGVSTGFYELDSMTCGLQPSDLIILAGRPSQGKTALALNIASHVALIEKKPAAVFSLEMTCDAIMMRLICGEARANLHEVRRGYFPKSAWMGLTNAAAKIADSPLWINDSPGLTVLEVRARARRLAAELKAKNQELGLIILDYLQMLRGSYFRPESRQQEVSEISRSLKNMARDLKVPVLALSQLSRRPEEKGRDGRPQLADLRESGAIEQDADLVVFVYREEVYKPNDPELANRAELIVAKQRNGPTGSVPLYFIKDYARFENPSRQEEQVLEPQPA